MTVATLGTQDTEQRQRKLKMSNSDSTKKIGGEPRCLCMVNSSCFL